MLPNSRIMVAGGREVTFKDRQKEIFEYGADSIVVGDYLTTKGEEISSDFKLIKSANCKIAKSC